MRATQHTPRELPTGSAATASGTYERRASAHPASLAAVIDPADALMAQLERGCVLGLKVTVFVRGDPSVGCPMRVIEGTPVAFRAAHDGRARVVLEIAPDTEQLVLLERIARVMVG